MLWLWLSVQPFSKIGETCTGWHCECSASSPHHPCGPCGTSLRCCRQGGSDTGWLAWGWRVGNGVGRGTRALTVSTSSPAATPPPAFTEGLLPCKSPALGGGVREHIFRPCTSVWRRGGRGVHPCASLLPASGGCLSASTDLLLRPLSRAQQRQCWKQQQQTAKPCIPN